MAAMKYSGAKWIGDIPVEWSITRLKDQLKINNGKEIDNDEGKVPVYGSGGAFKWTDKVLCNEPALLLGRKGTIDKPLLVKEPFWTVDTMFYSTLKNEACLDYLYFCSTCFDYKHFQTGSTLPSMTQTDLGGIMLPWPSVGEQHTIASYLNQKCSLADKALRTLGDQISLLQRYRASVIHEAVTRGLNPNVPTKPSGIEWFTNIPETWNTTRITAVAERHSGHTPNKETPEYWKDGNIVWISLADSPTLRGKKYVNASKTMTTRQGIAHSSAEVLPKGSVLLSRDASVGLCAIAGCDLAVSQHFMAYVCGPRLSNNYLLYCFKDMQQVFHKLSMGSTIPTIGLPLIKQLEIPLPTRQEQDAIVRHLDTRTAAIDAVLDTKRKQLDILKRRRQSLIYEYVTGKRRVTEEA